jgi:hypothetical protein
MSPSLQIIQRELIVDLINLAVLFIIISPIAFGSTLKCLVQSLILHR